MDDSTSTDPSQNPLDAVFEKAVVPFESPEELARSLPKGSLVVIMRKPKDAPPMTIETSGGATVKIPLLGALMESGAEERHKVAQYDFSKLGGEEIAVVYRDTGTAEAELRLVTRSEGGALLCADLGAMLDGLGKAADQPAFKAFPGGEFLVQALQTGLLEAKRHLVASLKDADKRGLAK